MELFLHLLTSVRGFTDLTQLILITSRDQVTLIKLIILPSVQNASSALYIKTEGRSGLLPHPELKASTMGPPPTSPAFPPTTYT